MSQTLTLSPDPALWLLAALFVGTMLAIVLFSFALLGARIGTSD